jgi:hypothetical protein
MRYSKSNIIAQHIEFCRVHNITVTQNDLNTWSTIPLKYLSKQLAKQRLDVAKTQQQTT